MIQHLIERIIRTIDETKLSITSWILSFMGILVVRYIFEALSTGFGTGAVTPDLFTFVHYSLFFLVAGIGMLGIVTAFIPSQKIFTTKALIYSLMVIWLAPVIDIFTTGIGTGTIHYLFDETHTLIFNFITFFGTNLDNGASLGIRIEIAIIMIGAGWFTYHHTRSWIRMILCPIALYTYIFILGSLPTTVMAIVQGVNPFTIQTGMLSGITFYLTDISQSVLKYTLLSSIYTFKGLNGFFGVYFSAFVGQFFFILTWVVSGIVFRFTAPRFWNAVMMNIRPERLLYYLIFVILGIAIGLRAHGPINWNWVDIISLITVILSTSSAWLSAVFLNDAYDKSIDVISNQKRPIPLGLVNEHESIELGVLFALIACTGGLLVGNSVLFFIVIFCALGVVYSVPPLRLKRIPLFSSFVLALASLMNVFVGFFFIHDGNLSSFPVSFIFGMLILITIFTNMRDIKDIDGDRANDMLTLPTLFGDTKARTIISISSGLAFAIVPPLLVPHTLSYIIFPLLGIILSWAIKTKKHPEGWIFSVFFVTMVLIIIFVLK